MNRRTFVKAASASAVSILAAGSSARAAEEQASRSPLRAEQIHQHLRSLAAVEEPSVDRFIIGDPRMVVKKLGTAWMPYWKTLRQAVAAGVNTLVVHEPTFYTHWDLEGRDSDYLSAPPAGREAYIRLREEKRGFIQEHGLAIIRCHDVPDRVPEFGIPYALGQGLGFPATSIKASRRFYNVHEVEPAPAAEVASRIAARLKAVKQPGVAFYGDPSRVVRTIGVGTGCICDPLAFMDLKPDLFIGIDDTVRTWVQTTFAEDSGHPLVVINHGTSEEFGMRNLNVHLRKTFPELEVIHFEQGCGYRWITG